MDVEGDNSIAPLHVRSGYSLLRGPAPLGRLLERASALGHARLALTDVNNLYGATVFWKRAAAAGLTPILGTELLEEAEGGGRTSVVALVADEAGYENLCRIITRQSAIGNHYCPVNVFGFSCNAC